MKGPNNLEQKRMEWSDTNESGAEKGVELNYDIQSYQFHDLDLAAAAKKLSQRDQTILVLHLMGHSQESMSVVFSLSRSMMSKRFTTIMAILKRRLNQSVI